jgi:hypothetical protein
MKLFLLQQVAVEGYDTYDSCVVVAENKEAAQKICPSGYYRWSESGNCWHFVYVDGTTKRSKREDWCEPKDVRVDYIGEADPLLPAGHVVCASYNAG